MIVCVYIMNLKYGNIVNIQNYIFYLNIFLNNCNIMKNYLYILKIKYIHYIIFYKYNWLILKKGKEIYKNFKE